VANEKEAKHCFLCSFDPMFEFFHNVEKRSPFWSTGLNVVQINYYVCETSALTRCFSDGGSAVCAYKSHSAKRQAGLSAHLLISQKQLSDRDAFRCRKSSGKTKI